jgi:hypothetical protein
MLSLDFLHLPAVGEVIQHHFFLTCLSSKIYNLPLHCAQRFKRRLLRRADSRYATDIHAGIGAFRAHGVQAGAGCHIPQLDRFVGAATG